MNLRPSSLPALAVSPLFVPDGEAGEYAEAGTVRHQAYCAALRGDRSLIDALPPDDLDGVSWAVEQTQFRATTGATLYTEQRVECVLPDWTAIAGTCDAWSAPELFDLKWRRRDYRAQMAAYGLAWMQTLDLHEIWVTVLFGADQHEERYTLTREAAEELLCDVVERAMTAKECRTSDYCGWCAKRFTCPLITGAIGKIVAGREDWSLPTYHTSDLTSAEDLGNALKIARAVAGWCESVEYRCHQALEKFGIVPTGYRAASRNGKRKVENLAEAFAASGLSQEQFLAACDVSFRRMADQLNGVSKKAAERELEKRLGNLVTRKTSSLQLIEEK